MDHQQRKLASAIIFMLILSSAIVAAEDLVDFPVPLIDFPEYSDSWKYSDISGLKSLEPEYFEYMDSSAAALCSRLPATTAPSKPCTKSVDWHYVTVYVNPQSYDPGTAREGYRVLFYATHDMALSDFDYNLKNNYGSPDVVISDCSIGVMCRLIQSNFADGKPRSQAVWAIYKNVKIEATISYLEKDPMQPASSIMSQVVALGLKGGSAGSGDDTGLCANGILDNGEEGIDCGGNCPECEYGCPEGYVHEGSACVKEDTKYSAKLVPENAEVYADGRTPVSLELVLVNEKGKPASGETAEIMIYDDYNNLDDLGKVSSETVRTGADGKASFTYTPPQPPDGKRFSGYKIRIQAKHAFGNPVSYMILNDARPDIEVDADPRALQDDSTDGGVSRMSAIIEDNPASKEWSYEISTSLGQVAYGTAMSGNVITGKTTENMISFRWVRPDDKVALRDFEFTLDRDDASSYKSFSDNLKRSWGDVTEDQEGKTISDAKAYMKDMKGSFDYVKEDYDRLKTGTYSKTETFLNMMSTGLEGLQVFYGSKGMVGSAKDYKESRDGLTTDQNRGVAGKLKKALEGTRDALIGYGVDELQARLRSWADAEHEANLDTIRLPVVVTVKVTDDTGLSDTEEYLLQYTYHFNPKVHLDRVNNPNAG